MMHKLVVRKKGTVLIDDYIDFVQELQLVHRLNCEEALDCTQHGQLL